MAYIEITHTTLAVTDSQDPIDLEGDYMKIILDETDMDMDGLDCDYSMDANSDTDDSVCDYSIDTDPATEETEEYFDTVEQPETEMDSVQDETVVETCDVEVSENRVLGMDSRELLALVAMIESSLC